METGFNNPSYFSKCFTSDSAFCPGILPTALPESVAPFALLIGQENQKSYQ